MMACAVRECTATLAITPSDRAFRIVPLLGGGEVQGPHRWTGLLDLSLIKAGETMLVPRIAGTRLSTDTSRQPIHDRNPIGR